MVDCRKRRRHRVKRLDVDWSAGGRNAMSRVTNSSGVGERIMALEISWRKVELGRIENSRSLGSISVRIDY
jgi:hypothetical protein